MRVDGWIPFISVCVCVIKIHAYTFGGWMGEWMRTTTREKGNRDKCVHIHKQDNPRHTKWNQEFPLFLRKTHTKRKITFVCENIQTNKRLANPFWRNPKKPTKSKSTNMCVYVYAGVQYVLFFLIIGDLLFFWRDTQNGSMGCTVIVRGWWKNWEKSKISLMNYSDTKDGENLCIKSLNDFYCRHMKGIQLLAIVQVTKAAKRGYCTTWTYDE